MLEDFRLRVFTTVVKCGSFTSAARELRISQPAVSQNISELERILGGRLLVRSRQEVVPTEKGKEFYEYALRILELYARAGGLFEPGGDENENGVARISLDENTDATVWSSGGDIRIQLIHK